MRPRETAVPRSPHTVGPAPRLVPPSSPGGRDCVPRPRDANGDCASVRKRRLSREEAA